MSRKVGRTALAVFAGCFMVSQHAAAQVEELGLLVGVLGFITEPFVPDLRLEFDRGTHWVLSWPLHISLMRFYPPQPEPLLKRYVASAFIEPQWIPGEGKGRFLAGTRQGFSLDGYGLLTDIGVVAGSGGPGWFVGAGPALLNAPHMSYLGLILRQTMTTDGPRRDISLDLLSIFY
jgi:hypothetical protein